MSSLGGETSVAPTFIALCFFLFLLGRGHRNLTAILTGLTFMEQFQPAMSSAESDNRARPDVFDFISVILILLLLHLITRVALTIGAHTASPGSVLPDTEDDDGGDKGP